jgi:hypothetical protein
MLHSDTNTNINKYEYKMDISNSDSHSNTYPIYNIESQWVSISFVDGFIIDQIMLVTSRE